MNPASAGFFVLWYTPHMNTAIQKKIITATLLVLTLVLVPLRVSAANQLEVAGWVPYWRVASSTADAMAHMDAFTEISPMVFGVKKDGTLIDRMRVASTSWVALMQSAHEKKVRVMPTITWTDADAMDTILRDPAKRKAHIANIMRAVEQYQFDGIDIDYEGKKAETKTPFSLFLRDLYKAMGKRFVTCSIEARTPLDSRFVKVPTDITYANDFVAINKYCDRVRIMAYDQGQIDLKLNKAGSGAYAPIADVAWVKKVIELAAKEISRKKIIIGIPTYGREYEVTPKLLGYNYNALWTFNQNYALDIAKAYNVLPTRNRAGELSFTYLPTATTSSPSRQDEQQMSFTGTGTTTSPTSTTTATRLLWWSDAQAVRDKIQLAKTLGVRGVSIFKIDGGEDQALWEVLK